MKNKGILLLCLITFILIRQAGGSGKPSSAPLLRQVISLDKNEWRIATDPDNSGREKGWFVNPPLNESKPTPVPWVIQDIFHNYHGVAWYWTGFTAPENPHAGGRSIIVFDAVDYKADVWLNGVRAGGHEGSETPFELDVTDIIKNKQENLLVVRVLNPTYEPIDGLVLKDTPSGAKQYPFTGNAAYNSGGIAGSVKLELTPPVRIGDVFVLTGWESGEITVDATFINQGPVTRNTDLSVRISGADHLLLSDRITQPLVPGRSGKIMKFKLADHKLWSPESPVMYTLELAVTDAGSSDVRTVRFGFRDFRFENGYFRLNGKRIFLRGTNFSTHFPAGYTVPPDERMLKADAVNIKAMGFNFVRIPFGCPNARVLDLYDELGILVQQEHFGCWQIGDYGGYAVPRPPDNNILLEERFKSSITEVILRDRNHPCLVMWGVLNENSDGVIFRKAVKILPELRKLDPSRLFVLNSGRFDGVKETGSMSNPGSDSWNVAMDELRDWHPYVWIPYTTEVLDMLSGRGKESAGKSYISETGLCFPVDLPSELGDYRLAGKEDADDAVYFRRQYDKFLNDWKNFRMDECWTDPGEYIRDAYRTASDIRRIAESAIRSNPDIVSYTPTNGVADAVAGESMATGFRRIKPELIGAVIESNEPLRWCLRTEPQSAWCGDSITITVSLSNLDILPAGKYPFSVKISGPGNKTVFEENSVALVPAGERADEPPFASCVYSKKIRVNGPPGVYTLLTSSLDGIRITCGTLRFYCSERSGLKIIPEEVILCGKDPIVTAWLKEHGVTVRAADPGALNGSEIIIMAGNSADSIKLPLIAATMARGSSVIFLSPRSFGNGKNTTRWLPLVHKGSLEPMDAVAGYYRADRWAKNHPLFEGFPTGGMLDYLYCRNIISINALSSDYTRVAKSMYTYDELNTALDYPGETVCGATRISHNYCSGIHLGTWNFGSGHFIVNTLSISENLGKDPAADKLLCNMLNYSYKIRSSKPASLPEDFDNILRSIGYK